MSTRIVPAVNRHTFLLLHRWQGLLLILPVLLLTLTGGVLVYKQELDQWLNAELMPPCWRYVIFRV